MTSKTLAYLSLSIGAIVVIYSQITSNKHILLTVIGVVLLFFGLASISLSIKGEKPPQSFIVNEDEEEE